ncbi:MAG: hypothetical protein ACON5F_02365 [Jejuia sp.]
MKPTLLFLALSFLVLVFGCKQGNQNDAENYYGDSYYDEYESEIREDDYYEEAPSYPNQNYQQTAQVNYNQEQSSNSGFFSGGKRKHQFVDARTGLVVSSTNYPSSWKVISKPIYTMDQKMPLFLMQIQGPNNLKTFNTPLKCYISYTNPQTTQWMQQYSSTARMMRPMVSNQQIMQEEVNNRMAKSGFQMIGQKNIPRAERYLRNEMQKEGLHQAQLEMYSTEWTNNKGQKALVNLVKIAMQQPLAFGDAMVMWFYSLDYMFVDADKFDDTIDTLMDATEATQKNPQWEQYMAQLKQVRQQKAAQQHRINMQNRQAAFDAHQTKMKGIWAAQDANHASFMNRNFGSGSDVSQKRFINMINEEETVYNPSTGQNYQVQAGSTEYWMDSDRNYIKNDDYFYNPNGDINLNNREWTRVRSAF